jgi:hypothetical protein
MIRRQRAALRDLAGRIVLLLSRPDLQHWRARRLSVVSSFLGCSGPIQRRAEPCKMRDDYQRRDGQERAHDQRRKWSDGFDLGYRQLVVSQQSHILYNPSVFYCGLVSRGSIAGQQEQGTTDSILHPKGIARDRIVARGEDSLACHLSI